MAALDGAFTFTERHRVAKAVGEDLDLDVADRREEALEEDAAIAECGLRFACRDAHGALDFFGIVHVTDALAAAPSRRLDQQREANARGKSKRLLGVDAVFAAGHDRHAGGDHRPARADLIAKEFHGGGLRADEGDARSAAGLGELRAFAQEAVAGVHGIDAGFLREVDDLVVVEVALERRSLADVVRLVGIADVEHVAVDGGVDGDRGDTHLAAGAHDA